MKNSMVNNRPGMTIESSDQSLKNRTGEWMQFQMYLRKALLVAAATVSVAASAAPVTFSFDYNDGADEGFNDAIYGADRRAALELAGTTWGSLLSATYAGENITVGITMDPMGASWGSFSHSEYHVWNRKELVNKTLVYNLPNANNIAGTALTYASFPDNQMSLRFNSDRSFYLGTDGNTPADQTEFAYTAMRAIARGLGFESRINGTTGAVNSITDATSGNVYHYFSLYDSFLVNGAGTKLMSMTDAQRLTTITGNDLYWNGDNATAANGGLRPKLSAPATYVDNSVVDLDPSMNTFLDSVVRKGEQLGTVNNPIVLGMLADMGWSVTAVPEPGSYAMLLAGLGLLGFVARRQKRTH